MKRWSVVCAALALLWAAPVKAQVLEALRPADAAMFTAVGVVNGAGPLGRATCSGTLIAPDLVLTAAHCVGGGATPRWFIPGGLGPRARIAVQTRRITVHPAYADRAGMARFAVDLALLELASPLPPAVATPLPLIAGAAATPERMAVVAFERDAGPAPRGRYDCAVAQGRLGTQMEIACPVVSGNSGAPALVWTASGWRVAGVVVAQLGRGAAGSALVAPLEQWLREIIAVPRPNIR